MTKIIDIKNGEKFNGLFMIVSSEVKQTKQGSDYLSLTFQDNTGKLSGNLWNVCDDILEFKPGTIVELYGVGPEFNGMPQIKITTVDRHIGKVKMTDFYDSFNLEYEKT